MYSIRDLQKTNDYYLHQVGGSLVFARVHLLVCPLDYTKTTHRWLGLKLINTLPVTSDLPPTCSCQMLFDCHDNPHGYSCLDPCFLRFCNVLQYLLRFFVHCGACAGTAISDFLTCCSCMLKESSVIDVFCSHSNFICNTLLIKELQPPPTLSDACLAPCRSMVAWNLHRWNASIFYLM